MRTRIAGIAACMTMIIGCSSTPQVRTAPPVVAAPAARSMPQQLSTSDSARIVAFIQSQNSTGGRGRGRNGGLPPGIARNLQRGKPLPPGIAKTYLPAELSRTLPPLDRALEYVVFAGKLLIVETATQIVREILLDTLSV